MVTEGLKSDREEVDVDIFFLVGKKEEGEEVESGGEVPVECAGAAAGFSKLREVRIPVFFGREEEAEEEFSGGEIKDVCVESPVCRSCCCELNGEMSCFSCCICCCCFSINSFMEVMGAVDVAVVVVTVVAVAEGVPKV